MTANITDTLSFEKKRALLAQLLEKEISKPVVFPLSFSQQRVWFFDQWEPQSPVYNIPAAIRFRGALDINALQLTLDEIVRRHEALRTTFPATDSAPYQLISPPAPFPLEFLDLSTDADSEAKAAQLMAREAARPFDLAHGPLFRGLLLQLSDQHFILVLNMHHIVSDGWSLGVLVNEVTSLYTAYHQGQRPNLPELPLQYADFAVWQRQWLSGAVLEEQLAYWRAQLGGALPALQLLSDKPRPAVQTYQGATTARVLPRQLSEELKVLTRREGATLFMTLLAAFQVLLYRYTGQQDILVGTPAAARSRAAFSNVVGYFVNPLVLRADLSGNPSFTQFLSSVRRTVLDAFAHQDYPFALLVKQLQPERDVSRSPLFQVTFVLQQAQLLKEQGLAAFALGQAGAPLRLSELALETMTLEQRVAQFDLSLVMAEVGGGLRACLDYNTDIFDEPTIVQIVRQFQILIEGIVADPWQQVSSLPLLSDEDRRQLLVEWNDTARDYGQKSCIHELFEEQVARTPEQVAVVVQEEKVFYRELNERANQLAHHLRSLGVGPEARVGILLERSVEIVVALLGVLKAGGAYVPLDPEYPAERLRFMMTDAEISVLLTTERLSSL